MISGLKFPFTGCNVVSADSYSPVHPQETGSGRRSHDQAAVNYTRDGLNPKTTTIKTSCVALSEQDVLKVFLGESHPVDNYFCLTRVCDVLDPLSSGLVGSLSAGSAGMIETQIALSNWESTHQTSRGRDHLFDYDQICDSSRGLVSARLI